MLRKQQPARQRLGGGADVGPPKGVEPNLRLVLVQQQQVAQQLR